MTKETARGKKKRRLNLFLLIRLVGILLFVYILTTVDLEGLWGHIRRVDAMYLFLGVLFQVVLLFLKGFRWHILNSGGLTADGLRQSL